MIRSAFVMAGTQSGCGKTTVSLGIMAALARRGFTVQPFKVGPDFIDPGHHGLVTGRSSHNLDGWMMDRECNRRIFERYAADADVDVVEGVMGLFDGFSGHDEAGSTAQMARWLGFPVVLVIDAASMARSAAAIALGFRRFDPRLFLAGVILNRVAGPGHAKILKSAFESVPEVPVLGLLQRKNKLAIPSRHLGLVTAEDMGAGTLETEELAKWIEQGVNIDGLLLRTRYRQMPEAPGIDSKDPVSPALHGRLNKNPVRIGVARDEAFCFYYQENLRLLVAAGAEIVRFSPLRDTHLPPDLAGIILGGGYPELHCKALSANHELLKEIRDAASGGMPVYAECGGFMFLMDEIEDAGGRIHAMAGVFPFKCRMEKRLKSLGYREIMTREDSIIGPKGTVVRGHEFHYSAFLKKPSGISAIYRISERKEETGGREGFQVNRVLGSYVHLHWGSNPEVARSFVTYCHRHGSNGERQS